MSSRSDNSSSQGLSLIVGVGASAAGLKAFEELLTSLESTRDMALILVRHLDPRADSHLAELLSRSTSMDVVQAEHGAPIEADTAYVIPPDMILEARDGRIALSKPASRRDARMPIDRLFASLAEQYGNRAVGVVMSGGGNDGTGGLRAIKAAGGLTIAQRPQQAGHPAMPENAIAAGVVDVVVSIADIPAVIELFAQIPATTRSATPTAGAPDDSPSQELSDEAIEALASVLAADLDFDIHAYKPGTIRRRAWRRLRLCGYDCVEPFVEHVRQTPELQRMLVQDFLIGVTEFFRDPHAFETLRTRVIEALVAEAEPSETLRVWVAGCATGQEAYSIAILFLEAIARSDRRLDVRLFATDIDQEALAIARAGIYPPIIAEQVPQVLLDKYFTHHDGGGYQVTAGLRDVISFAPHDLCQDPPFSRMHLVSCRNLLIYLRAEAQEQVIRALHFALRPDCYLFLGSSEAISSQRQIFSTLSDRCRIFQKLGTARPLLVSHRHHTRAWTNFDHRVNRRLAETRPGKHLPDDSSHLRQAILAARVGPTIVVADDGEILFTHGDLQAYLQFPDGQPRLQLDSVLRPQLGPRVRAAVHRCRREDKTVEVVARVDTPDSDAVTRITASVAPQLGSDAVIVTFTELDSTAETAEVEDLSAEDQGLVEQLEDELLATREDLRNTVEELESSNEELRASHEESLSMNEELQSANEELEATGEELRSLNEELSTVNSRLRQKVDEVRQAHNDLSNFVESTQIATVFLDDALCVARFTPAAEQLLGIGEAHRGRSIDEIDHALLGQDLIAQARSVLATLSPIKEELSNSEQRWFRRGLLPYRTDERRVEGVVITLTEITDIKHATERLAVREAQQATIASLGMQALEENDLGAFMERAVREAQMTLGTDFSKILELQPGGEALLLRAGAGWSDGLVGRASVSADLDSQAGYTLISNGPVIVEDISDDKRFSGPALLLDHGVTSGLSCTIRTSEGVYGVFGAHTRQRREFGAEDANFLQAVASLVGEFIQRIDAERAQLASQQRYRSIFESAGVSLWEQDFSQVKASLDKLHADGVDDLERYLDDHPGFVQAAIEQVDIIDINSETLRLFGADRKDRLLESLAEIFVDQTREVFIRQLVCLASGEAFFGADTRMRRLDGEPIDVAFTVRFPQGESLEHVLVSLMDITELKRAQRALEESRRWFNRLTEATPDLVAVYDLLDERVVYTNQQLEDILGYTSEQLVANNAQLREQLIHPNDRDQNSRFYAALGDEDSTVDEHIHRVRHADGSFRWLHVRAAPFERTADGRVRQALIVARDITDFKQTQSQLEEASRQKDEFLAMLGHELRNPLAAVRTAAEHLKLTHGEDPQLKQTQAVLERQTSHMAKLLDGLLDVSRIVRGKITLEMEAVNLTDTLREVIQDRWQLIEESGLELQDRIGDEPVWVSGDRVRLTQIVDNLLSNATKYTTAPGSVTVSLTPSNDHAVIEVRDTGVGIDPELLPYIFESFRQAKQKLDRASGGLGLGLALVKELVELHRGTVEAHSDGPDEGATFLVELPLAQRDRRRRGESVPPGAQGPRRVLVVEDNGDAARLLRSLLEMKGHRVEVAHDGQTAIAIARSFAPQIILCDLGLPGGMTGYEVAERLRADIQFDDVHLIAVSGYGRPEDKRRCRQAGFDDHATKPLDLSTLERLLAVPTI